MYTVRTASTADLDAVVELMTRLQSDPAHQIGFLGETEDEVTEELTELKPDWASGTAVAVDSGGRLRGVLCVDADPEQRRAYLFGPFVDVPAKHPAAGQLWRTTADALLDHVAGLPRMAGIETIDLFGNSGNRLLADFAARHELPVNMTTRCFLLTAAPLRSLLVKSTVDDRVLRLPDDPEVRAAVVRLHDESFPGAPTSGRQLVDSDRHTVVVLLGNGGPGSGLLGSGLLGYAAGYAQAEEYYVDSVAVDPATRSCGVGRTLVRRLLAELSSAAGPRNRAAAMIRDGNDASERMFTKLGFELASELVAYRGPAAAMRTTSASG